MNDLSDPSDATDEMEDLEDSRRVETLGTEVEPMAAKSMEGSLC